MLYGCLFGYGRAGKIHFNNLINNTDICLKYIYDTPSELCNILDQITSTNKNINVTSNLQMILDDKQVNVCIICTPTSLHFSLIMACLSQNKHVFCEKPISNIENEIKDSYSLAREKNLVLLCALNRRFDPNIMQLKSDITKLGNIYQINTVSRDYPYPTYNYLKISSGLFADCAVHDIDYINWLLDDRPKNVYVSGSVVMPEKIGAGELDNAIIIMEYSGGIMANINLSRISTTYDQRIEIFGAKGKLMSSNPYNEKYIDLIETREDKISFPQRYCHSYRNELSHFIQVIYGNVDIKVKMCDVLNCIRIVEACEKSFRMSCKTNVYYDM